MFPGPNAQIYRNEAGEVLGWDYPPDEPYEPDPYEADYYDDPYEHTYDCPACHSSQEIEEQGESPSMLGGHASDPWLRLECGHTITFDPFTGNEVVLPK